MSLGMQTHEHTPQSAPNTPREAVGNPTPQKDTPTIEITIHTQEMSISKETVPGPHYHYESKEPGEAEDIKKNSSLYWGVATF